jgi:two-component system, sensor histidine kinase
MSPTHTAAPASARYPYALVLCVIAPAILLATWILYGSAARERSSVQEALQQKAEQLAAEVDAELERSVAALKVLAMSTSLQRGDLRGFHELATRTVRADPAWNNLQLISTEGEQLVNVRLPFGTPLPPLNRPELALQAVYKRAPVVADLALGVVAQRMLTPIYVPVFRDGAVAYVIGAAIEPPNWQFMLRSRMPPGMQAVLLDRFSFVVTTTYDVAPVAGPPESRALMPPNAPGELSGDFTQGGRFEVAQRKAGFSGWTVVTFVQPDEQPSRQRWLLPATVALLLLVCGVAVGLGFSVRARQHRSATAA